jgi:hypothetical protein
MKRFVTIIILLSLCLAGIAQEIITELETNPVIKARLAIQLPSDLKSVKDVPSGPVALPFMDDFSSRDPFPSANRWQDRYAFINTDYPVNPPNVGVATLDAINDEGEIYPMAIPGPPTFQADLLTSRPIRMDSVFKPTARPITPADSIYLSFFYQPQGRGNAPEYNDLLVLEFGTYTGDSVFVAVDSIEYLVDTYYYPGDSLLLPCPLPDDSIWVSINPYLIMHNGQFMLMPSDEITLPCDSIFEPKVAWKEIWHANGSKLDTNFYTVGKPLTYFRRIMIPITDTSWLKPDFQFRFKNYVSLADNSLPSWQSNADHWNIDMVYLNIDRSFHDTTFKMLSFVDRSPSMIKRYEAMPYHQYRSDPTNIMKDSINMVITNLDTLIHNTSYRYVVSDKAGIAIDSCLRGNWDIPPVYESGYLDYINFAKPPVCFGFFPIDFTKDSAIFTVAHYLTTGAGSGGGLNDTLWAEQIFKNYYAYDDGSAEAGYGLTPRGSQLAYRFDLNEPDTLRAVQMYFNETRTGANLQQFYICVWKDDNGKPGQLIHTQSVKQPEYTKVLNQFYTYLLDTSISVTSTFYIGWIQTTDDNLNIGFDRHNQSQQYIFYNVTGEWVRSIQEGSLMMRPVLGKPLVHSPEAPVSKSTEDIDLYPNPVKDGILNIRLPDKISNPNLYEQFTLELFNLMGQQIYKGAFSPTMDTSGLQEGMYVVIVKGIIPDQFYTGKLMIIR